jgi:hypothetical protein
MNNSEKTLPEIIKGITKLKIEQETFLRIKK